MFFQLPVLFLILHQSGYWAGYFNSRQVELTCPLRILLIWWKVPRIPSEAPPTLCTSPQTSTTVQSTIRVLMPTKFTCLQSHVTWNQGHWQIPSSAAVARLLFPDIGFLLPLEGPLLHQRWGSPSQVRWLISCCTLYSSSFYPLGRGVLEECKRDLDNALLAT